MFKFIVLTSCSGVVVRAPPDVIRHHPSSLSTGNDCCCFFFWRSQILFKVCACKLPPFFTTLTVWRSDLSLLVDLRVRFATLCNFFFFGADFPSCVALCVALTFSCTSWCSVVLSFVVSRISAAGGCSSSCSASLTSRDTAGVVAPEATDSSPESYSASC